MRSRRPWRVLRSRRMAATVSLSMTDTVSESKSLPVFIMSLSSTMAILMITKHVCDREDQPQEQYGSDQRDEKYFVL